MKNWHSSKAGRLLSWLILFLALGSVCLSADTLPDFEPSTEDPIIAKGSGVEIKQSEFDEAAGPMKFEYLARGRTLPPYFSGVVTENLIEYDLLLGKSIDADRIKGCLQAIND